MDDVLTSTCDQPELSPVEEQVSEPVLQASQSADTAAKHDRQHPNQPYHTARLSAEPLREAIQALQDVLQAPPDSESGFQAGPLVDMIEQLTQLERHYADYVVHAAQFVREEIETAARQYFEQTQRDHERNADHNNQARLAKERAVEIEQTNTDLSRQIHCAQIDKRVLDKKLDGALQQIERLHKRIAMQDRLLQQAELRTDKALRRAVNFKKLKDIESRRRIKAEKQAARAVQSAKEALKYLFEYNTPGSNKLANRLMGLD